MLPSAVRKRIEQFRHTITNSLTQWRTTCMPKMLLEEHKGGIDTFLRHALSLLRQAKSDRALNRNITLEYNNI
jgi:hypothetical protein